MPRGPLVLPLRTRGRTELSKSYEKLRHSTIVTGAHIQELKQ
jgi:hypothetical protein